jgi:ABC-2 type transport system ATP-binding protein
LRKAYGEKVVLDGVDLTLGEGEVFALLGPNGAGKTTIVRILSTLIPADAGTATVMGYLELATYANSGHVAQTAHGRRHFLATSRVIANIGDETFAHAQHLVAPGGRLRVRG